VIAAISVSGPIERMGRRPGEKFAMPVVRAGQRLSGL
jgi:DNA-binding IclR family transcriptional regulator